MAIKGGGAPRGNKNAVGAHTGVGRSFLGVTVYDISKKAGKSAFQAKFPKATDAFLKKYSSKRK